MQSVSKRCAVLMAVAAVFGTSLFAAETEGVHCSVITDQDGDEAVLLESEWISMHLTPRLQAIITRFVFRPTGNDIQEVLQPKMVGSGISGLLSDCLWEQDHHFQELIDKPYSYKITKTGPEEGQVIFETDIVGWVGSENSGVISKLLSNLTLKRSVTLKAGQPFFRFDVEFVSNDNMAKRPTYWVHNVAVVDQTGLESVLRPSARAIIEIVDTFHGPKAMSAQRDYQYIYDFVHGWSTRMARQRREGIVYLMDYDYIQMLYNCGNITDEWIYDSILAMPGKPWKGHVYILPIIGLSGVDYANEYFILEMKPKREEGKLKVEYFLTSSFEKAAQITLNTEVEYNLLPEKGNKPGLTSMSPVVIDGLSIQAARGQAEVAFDAGDPLVFNITAFVQLPDGSTKKFKFQHYHAGQYDSSQGINTQLTGAPVRHLDRAVQRPIVPQPNAGLRINRDEFNVFGVLGLGCERMGLRPAVLTIPKAKFEMGYCTGRDLNGYALGDFPYDYDRLFKFRALVLGNTQMKEIRGIGASILLPWLKAGGGLVFTGGENAFDFELREHEINSYLPIKPEPGTLRQGALQLQPPLAKDHPIFRGLDLSDLPWLLYCHDIKLKEGGDARVLMTVGQYPFIVEKRTGDQITMVVACNHFGGKAELGDKTHLRNWSQWPKLFANIVRYAGGDLK